MNKVIITIGGIIAALSLSACATPPEQVDAAPTATTTPSGPTLDEMLADVRDEPEPEFSDDDEFIYDIERDLPDWRDSGSRSDIINLGNVICESFDGGLPFGDALSIMIEGTDIVFAEVILAAAIVNYCPEHEDKVSY